MPTSDPGERRVPLGLGDRALGDLAVELAADPLQRPVELLLADVEQADLEARERATWAMPLPIWPAPITPMRRISGTGDRS